MKKCLFLIIVSCLATPLFSQYVYTINADSVKITNHCDTAELIIENHTQNVPGFLFNKGRGRTEFRRGLFTIDDTLYLIGADTLNLTKALNGLYANNGLQKIDNTIQFGNDDNSPYYPAGQIRNTYYYQGGTLFNWMTGSNLFTVSKYQYSSAPETNALRNYYLARFYNPQGGILMEGNVKPGYNGPLAWINFKNDHPDAVTTGFFGDPIAAGINCLAVQGTDSKIYHQFHFVLPNDTPKVANGTVLRLFPTHVYPFGSIKIPTTSTTRLSVEDNISGCGNCVGPLNANNPYSSLVVDARNNPLVVGNLPSNTNGRMLIIDNNGKIWKGDTATGGGGGSGSAAWSLTGNAGTNPSADFLGTTDNQRLVFKTNNTEAMTILPSGDIGIGVSNFSATKVQIHKSTPDGQFGISGEAPSLRFWGADSNYATADYRAVLGLATQLKHYSDGTVPGDMVLSNYTKSAIVFSTDYINNYTTGADEKMRIDGDGHVGINTKSPTARLHVVDSVRFESLPAGSGNYLLIDGDGYLHVGGGSGAAANTPDSIRSSLAVNGDITAKKLKLSQTGWPDYVFDSAYRRISLPDLEQYIKQHNHLPEIPSAAEVTKKGIDVGDNQAALLKKIEELTLYLIEQGKELQTLKKEMAELKKTNKN